MKKSILNIAVSALQRVAISGAVLALAFVPGRALAQRPVGVDVSSYQGSINWTSVRNSGITYAWAKATEGVTVNDGYFVGNENNGKAAGVYMGAYHFARPNLNSPAAEASHFWGVAGPYIKADGKSFMPMLDFEVFSGVVGASSYSDWANQWCNAIVSDASAAGTVVKPVLYTSACSACNFNSSVAQWISWIADYNGQNPQTGTPWSVCGSCDVWGGGSWSLWQFSSSGSVSGIAGNVDMDVFNGNDAGLVVVGTGPTYLTNRVGMARSASGAGYWIAASDGGVFSFGDAHFYGSMGGQHLNAAVVGIAARPQGDGYWLVGADGGIFSFGNAGFHGSMGGQHLNAPVVGMSATPSGNGYWLVGSDGGIFGFGDAGFHGSMGGQHLNAPVVGMSATPSGNGYWLVGSDGGIFAFGDAGFHGSMGGQHLNAPVVGMASNPAGTGYWLVGADGGIFGFNVGYYGSEGGQRLAAPIVGMSSSVDGSGYWLVGKDGGIFSFGDAPFEGSAVFH
ncbi:glycoside hydrolase family 25 protein [Pedosphaera parvula]|uniref:Glycoside hydrolase family 25 n=1 Tax=Pedosphaera parvula (strain Ellin514) TaxID=320771 RepID=B9XCS0_PEDPL|nr:glycoside hydrolase family 25 protein [Pedosphaera parvula]EEF62266.1 glycoside hydrolase family 25 [Pedosphaera parvula Ellin514]